MAVTRAMVVGVLAVAAVAAVAGAQDSARVRDAQAGDARPSLAYLTRPAMPIGAGRIQLEATSADHLFEFFAAGTRLNATTLRLTIGLTDRLDLSVDRGEHQYAAPTIVPPGPPQCSTINGHLVCEDDAPERIANVAYPVAVEDAKFSVSWLIGRDVPVMGVLSVRGAATVPTGTDGGERGLYRLSAAASRELGPIHLDVNAGAAYAQRISHGMHLSGSAAARGRLVSWLGWNAELAAYPVFDRVAGVERVTSYRYGPTLLLTPDLRIDAGVARTSTGNVPDTRFLGLTWRTTKLW